MQIHGLIFHSIPQTFPCHLVPKFCQHHGFIDESVFCTVSLYKDIFHTPRYLHLVKSPVLPLCNWRIFCDDVPVGSLCQSLSNVLCVKFGIGTGNRSRLLHCHTKVSGYRCSFHVAHEHIRNSCIISGMYGTIDIINQIIQILCRSGPKCGFDAFLNAGSIKAAFIFIIQKLV